MWSTTSLTRLWEIKNEIALKSDIISKQRSFSGTEGICFIFMMHVMVLVDNITYHFEICIWMYDVVWLFVKFMVSSIYVMNNILYNLIRSYIYDK